MSKAIILIMLLALSTTSFSQQTNSSPSLSKNVYLQKSKKQITVGFVLLGAGWALVFTSILIARYGTDDGFEAGAYMVFMGGPGVLLSITSIPFFIASTKNKKKGMSLSFKNEGAPEIQKGSFIYRSVPSLSLKINL